ncbi:MAG: hypothetical protein V3S46_02580 [Nitrospinota bacterium]
MDADLTILQTIIDTLSDLSVPFAAEHESQSVTKMLKENMDAAEEMVREKTQQVGVIFALAAIPIVLIVVGFAVKLLYDMYTGAADKVAEGVKAGSNIIKDASDKLKKAMVKKAIDEDDDDDYEDEEEEEPPAKKVKKMLFGEILKKFVMQTLADEEIKEALAIQKNSNPPRKIGQILEDTGKISKTEIAHVLKIQKKQAG